MDVYLSLVPRGLNHVVQTIIEHSLLPKYNLTMKVVGEDSSLLTIENAIGELSRKKQHGEIQKSEKKRRRLNCIQETCSKAIGVYKDKNDQEFGFGYDGDSSIWSTKGTASGVVWLRIETDAPASLVYSIRCLGPLLALCDCWENLPLGETRTLSEVVEILRSVSRDTLLDKALAIWKHHALECWPLSPEAKRLMKHRIERNLRFRLSCMRNESKTPRYARHELLAKATPIIVPAQFNSSWSVELEKYDLEVVLLLRSTALAVGLCLRPYNVLGVKSFDSGRVPPDVSLPHLDGRFLDQVVRLRPSTAATLLHFADLTPGDLIVDPCVGIGTIALESLFQSQPVISFGGDLILTPEKRLKHASRYADDARRAHLSGKVVAGPGGASDLLAWDGCCLPIRSGSVDAVLSDLPFGQKCLSSNKLAQVLPLLFDEMARILRPTTGRAVLLCGAAFPVLECLQEANTVTPNTWCLPCISVFPVNIGGLQAWVIKVGRGKGDHKPIKNYTARLRKLTGIRNHIDRSRDQTERWTGSSNSRRLQK